MATKKVRMTESDLNRLVKKVITEQKEEMDEGKKYEFINEHPSFKELNSKISELKKFMKTIGKDLVGGIDYVEEHVEDKLFNK